MLEGCVMTGYGGYRFTELEREAYRTQNQLALEILKRLDVHAAAQVMQTEQKARQDTLYREID